MLGFFLDSGLTRPITAASPKRFLLATAGATKSSTVYLGDPYVSRLSRAASVGASTLYLDDVNEFPAAGTATVGAVTIAYTGKSGQTLTGVTGVTGALDLGAVIRPLKLWKSRSDVKLFPAGPDRTSVSVSLGLIGVFGDPGEPLTLTGVTSIATDESVAVSIRIGVSAGAAKEFSSWSVVTSAFFPRAVGDSSAITTTEFGVTPTMYGYVNRQDQPLPQRLRLLPVNRDISTAPAGLILGQYVWRDSTEINAQAIVPTSWKIDPFKVGAEKFIAGIGGREDLAPVDFVQENNSIYLTVKRGHYFTGPNGYFLPANPQLDVLSSLATSLKLSATPQPTLPVFVGNYTLDSQGFYEKGVEYRYQTAAAVAAGVNLPEYYFTLDRKTRTVTLSKAQTVFDVYLGTISGKPSDYFDLPVYPVDHVESVYVRRADGTRLYAVNWTVDYEKGRVVITSPSGSGTSVTDALESEAVMATCSPAVAVLYDSGAPDTRVLDSVDLNPAFAGISGGFIYLQHSRQDVGAITFACDKPMIAVPKTLSSIIGLIAYGPVFFDGDYALLQVTAYSKVPGQVIQGARLRVVVDPDTFTGTLNYQDPTEEEIVVTTGSDGTANLVFRPSKDYGVYIPNDDAAGGLSGRATTTVSNDTIVLPEAVPISQLYSSGDDDPWLVTLHTVLNDNPLLGVVGANPALGQVAWATSGTPGGVNYKTNGERVPLLDGAQALRPTKILDASGRDYFTNGSGFDGNALKLVYGQTIPSGTTVGSYFLTFLQRTLLRVSVDGSNVESNSVLLQMQPPLQISDQQWLILNDVTNGILNQYRLGWMPDNS